MTMSLHPQLGAGDVRKGLTALLRRRIPSQEVEDVAQTVLADALAAPRIPTDPEELRRWLTGIARHKIADFHRRAGRARNDVEAVELAAAPPAAFEEREVLQALLGEKRSRREAEAMEWLVREHAGERLADIAAEQGLPAPVVRQRVSRLRRALRSRWAAALGLLLVVGAFGAGHGWSRAKAPAIAPDPSEVVPALSRADAFLQAAAGDWVLASLTGNVRDPERRALSDAKLHIEGGRAEMTTRTLSLAGSLTVVATKPDGAVLRFTSPSMALTVDVRVQGRELRLSTDRDRGRVSARFHRL